MKKLFVTISLFACASAFAQHGLDKDIANIENKSLNGVVIFIKIQNYQIENLKLLKKLRPI